MHVARKFAAIATVSEIGLCRQRMVCQGLLSVAKMDSRRCVSPTLEPPSPPVKQIIAIVKPFLVEEILNSLRRAPLEAVEVREVKGYGKQKSYLDQYTDSEYSQAFLPKVEIVLWVDDARVEEVVRKVVEVARTGRMGDGKIFVLPAESYERVIDLGTANHAANAK